VLELPKDMQVDDCWATVWRLQAHEAVPASRFVSEWQPGFGWYAGGADSGQGLAAQTWNDGVVTVTIGTESGDWLADRAHRGDWLPRRLETYYGSVFDNRVEPFYLSARGLAVPVPVLTQGERCQIQFVVAWSRQGPDDAWTWYAVQHRPDQILNGAGCT
jgi:hypothetical protein